MAGAPEIAFVLVLAAVLGYVGCAFTAGELGGQLGTFEWYRLFGPQSILNPVLYDPLVLDLDGDGVELKSLDGSTVHFDLDNNGFAERTGWVLPDDGILVRDINGNGSVDGASELFGSPDQDGFAVLERMDTNGDGKIDASDANFAQLYVWRDLNQNGSTDVGELVALQGADINSISLDRESVVGSNEGNAIGFGATFTRANGTIGTAQSVYFRTDRQDTVSDQTQNFDVAEGVLLLPQLRGSGEIIRSHGRPHSIPRFGTIGQA